MGANQKSFQTRPTKTAGWAHLNGENEGRNAAEGCDVATLFVPCRPLAAGGRSAAFGWEICAKKVAMRPTFHCDGVAECRGDVVTKRVGRKVSRRYVVKNLCCSDGII